MWMNFKLVIFKYFVALDRLSIFQWNYSQVHTKVHVDDINFGPVKGLMTSGKKLLSEQMFTKIYIAMWHH